MDTESRTYGRGWWRWPVLPFAAVGGALAGTVILVFLLWLAMKFRGATENGWYFRYIVPVTASALFGYLYAYISCAIAPRGKVIAGVVMTTALGLVCLISVLLSWFIPQYTVIESIRTTFSGIATIISSIAAVIIISRDV